MLCINLFICKYPWYSNIRHFAPVIQKDSNKPCGLGYKVHKKKNSSKIAKKKTYKKIEIWAK